MNDFNPNDMNELYHHGILGQKWGVRRFQNKNGSLTSLGKKHREGDSGSSNSGDSLKKKLAIKFQKRKIQKQADAKKKSEEEAQKSEEELRRQAEAHEAARQKAITSGSAKDIMKFQGEYSEDDMRRISNRMRFESDMAGYASKEISPGKAKVDKFFNTIDTITTDANKAIKLYNTGVNIANSIFDLEVRLPRISTEINKDNIEDRRKDKKERQKRLKQEEKHANDMKAKKEAEEREAAEEKAKAKEQKAKEKKEQERYEQSKKMSEDSFERRKAKAKEEFERKQEEAKRAEEEQKAKEKEQKAKAKEEFKRKQEEAKRAEEERKQEEVKNNSKYYRKASSFTTSTSNAEQKQSYSIPHPDVSYFYKHKSKFESAGKTVVENLGAEKRGADWGSLRNDDSVIDIYPKAQETGLSVYKKYELMRI